MSGINRVMVMGNLAADPDLRQAGSTTIMKLRLGVTERYKDKSGEWKDRTEWVNATLFGARAEALGKVLSKGERVFIEGSLHTSSYEKNGEKRYSTEVNVSNIILCGSKKEGGSDQRPAAKPKDAAAPKRVTDAELAGDAFSGDEEIPF